MVFSDGAAPAHGVGQAVVMAALYQGRRAAVLIRSRQQRGRARGPRTTIRPMHYALEPTAAARLACLPVGGTRHPKAGLGV
jgi:hypothetical protein